MFVPGILYAERTLEHRSEIVHQMSPMNGAEVRVFMKVSGFPYNNWLCGHPDSTWNPRYVSIATLFISFMGIDNNLNSSDGHGYILIHLRFWCICEGHPASYSHQLKERA